MSQQLNDESPISRKTKKQKIEMEERAEEKANVIAIAGSTFSCLFLFFACVVSSKFWSIFFVLSSVSLLFIYIGRNMMIDEAKRKQQGKDK